MKSKVVAAVLVLVLLCAVSGMAVSSYPYELQRKLKHTIGENPFVTVGEVYEDDEGGHGIDVVCTTADTGQGLAFMLNTDFEWGGGPITVTLLDENGDPIVFDESALSGDPVQDTEDLILKALQYNRLFVSMPEDVPTFAPYDVYVGVRAEAVQFWNDDLSNYDFNSTFMVEEVFEEVYKGDFFEHASRVSYYSAPKIPSAGHKVGVVPAAARTAGKFGSFWTTDLWIYHEGATSLQLWFNAVSAKTAEAPTTTISLDENPVHISDVVGTLFDAQGKGSLGYSADASVTIISRTWTAAEDGGTYGQIIRGLPTSSAAAPVSGDDGVLRMVASQREGFRANLGMANPTGDPVTVEVDILTADGESAPGDSSFTVDLEPYEMTQIGDVLARLEPGEYEGLVITARVVAGDGKIVAYLSEVDNTTNDPSYQEAFQF